MRAVVITKHGGVEGLEVLEVDDPPLPAADRVRVRVHAAGLNRADVLQRLGHYPAPPGYPPDIPGLEFAGEVDEVGHEVRNWKRGQRVFGITAGGAQAEFVVVPENHLAEIPANLDWAEAAAVPEVFITAHDALFTRANLRPGETMLVHAAGSGVGTAAIQLARAAGARAFGTSRTADKLERAKQYGLQSSLVIEDDPSVLVEAVAGWTGRRGINVIIDLVGARYLEVNLKILAAKGRLVLVSTAAGAEGGLSLSTVMSKRLTIVGTVLRSRSAEDKATATRLFAEQVVPLLADGRLTPVVDRVYKLEEIRAAHARMESNESFGKIVLLM
ncbi:MAG TPA: NAD(P)H-quinone oxidoreductase [Pyrinomonadaceae bacterium]|jgi:putative PIG3 family NAD(P)H quinone oxidoreductase|nr:NAD(P)H-quinone oxidoreductase [Pyrinomonadaceae bacterium]